MSIVVTGVGAITALGATAAETWTRVVAGERGLRELTLFEAEGYRTTIVAEVRGVEHQNDPTYSRTSELGLRAAHEALTHAAFGTERPKRFGLVMGGTTAGMLETESLLAVILSPEGAIDPSARKEALRKMLSHPLSAPTDRLAKELGPFTRVRSLSSACSSGANAILVGATWLDLGLVDAVLCGSADALCRVTLSGFNSLGALDPNGARPFDVKRRGLTLGEGAGFVVLERDESAQARSKKAICALAGWASRSEAHHITNPEPKGEAPYRAMRAALDVAGLTARDVDYVNAHGTGTPLNDPMESRAIGRLLGDDVARVPVSSVKGQIGHTLAAAGAIEAVLTAFAIERGVVPPTGGLEEPDPSCPLLHVTKAEERPLRAAITSSFGFGGMDTVLVLARPELIAPRMPKKARRVVVTGVATLTPVGVREGRGVAELPSDRATESFAAIPENALDADRARRLDRASRLGAVVCGPALGGGPHLETGIVLGSAFGALDTTSAFMRRLREKGARLVPPADFPSLVPSSPAGHISIYLGLGGPSFVVADLAASGESAFVQAWELVAAGELDRVCVAAVEERSALVESVLRVIFGGADDEAAARSRREGAAAIALAPEGTTEDVLARVDAAVTWNDETEPLAQLGPAPDGAVVVLGVASPALEALLAKSAWAGCRRVVCAESTGTHEAAGGAALAVAAAMIAAGKAPCALVVGLAQSRGYAGKLVR